MSHSVLGVFLVVLVVAFFVLGLFGVAIHLYGVSEMTWGTYGGRVATYSDYNLGLSVRYPKDFVVNNQYFYAGLGANQQIRGVSFSVPADKLKGTNLLPGTHVSVEVIPNIPTCSVGLFLSSPTDTTSFIENDVLYSTAVQKNVHKESEYEERVYAVSDSSPCVAMRYHIRTKPLTSYSSEQNYDRENLIATFDFMRHSLFVQR